MHLNFWFYFSLVGYVISLLTIPFILMSQKRPAGILAWLWAMILFPYLAPLAYLFFGSEQLYRKRLLRRHNVDRPKNPVGRGPRTPELAPIDHELSRQLSKINVYPGTQFETAQLLINAKEFYPALAQAIREAKSFIHFEVFIWRNDQYGAQFLRLLTEAAARGVKVRLMLDEMGSYAIWKSYFAPLVAAGGEFSWFNALHPLHNRWAFSLRNHRKLQIIDGKVAFVGGMNLGREYMGEDPHWGHWQDIQIRLTGPVVETLTQTFHDDWYFATQQLIEPGAENIPPPADLSRPAHVVEEGPDSTKYPLVLSMLSMLGQAQKSIWLTAGYFFPQEPLLSALKLCAARGVDVRLLVGIRNEHPYIVRGAEFYYEELLSYGVKIFQYSSGVHHAKVMLMDDLWISVGSANLDVRSQRLNFELNVVLYSPECAKVLKESLLADFNASQQVYLESFSSRSSWRRVTENLCRLVGPLV